MRWLPIKGNEKKIISKLWKKEGLNKIYLVKFSFYIF